MLKGTLSLVFKKDKYALMFLVYGLLLGMAFHIFNEKGKHLVTSILGALSSPDLFFLLLFTCAIFLCPRNIVKGTIKGDVSIATTYLALFPGEAAIAGMRSLLSLLIGLLVPLWVYGNNWGVLVGVFSLWVLVTMFMSALLFSFSYEKTTWKSLGDTGFRLVNGVLLLSMVVLFLWEFILSSG